jgi:sec-independent protein translocase protein TatC
MPAYGENMITKNDYTLNFGENNYLKLLFLLIGFFILGLIFTYLIIEPLIKNYFSPYVIDYFKNFTTQKFSEKVIEQASSDLIFKIYLVLSFFFELPVLLIYFHPVITRSQQTLKALRVIIIIFIWIIAAILTPQDVIMQFFIALPLMVLMEFFIQLSKIIYKELPVEN